MCVDELSEYVKFLARFGLRRQTIDAAMTSNSNLQLPISRSPGEYDNTRDGVAHSDVRVASWDFRVRSCELEFWSVRGRKLLVSGPMPYLARRGHRVEHARDDLRRAGAAHVVGRFGFQEFGVREDDAKLIVETMKEQTKVRSVAHGCLRVPLIGRRHYDASLLVRSAARPGSRQSVSTKMRTEPPAVRTYSTLPLAIQL